MSTYELASHATATNAQLFDFINGVLIGFVQEDNLAGLQKCMSDISALDVEVNKTLADFKSLSIITAIQDIQILISDVSADVKDCEDMGTDWTRIEAWLSQFQDPVKVTETIAMNLVKNFAQIDTDIKTIQSDETAGDYKGAGILVAQITTDVLGPVPASSVGMTKLDGAINFSNLENFVNGLLTGLVQDDDLSAVQICFTDASSLSTDVEAAISDFKDHKWIDGVKNIGTILEGVKADIADCESMKTDWSRIDSWSDIFHHPIKLGETVIKNAAHNFDAIIKDVDQLKADESTSNYKDIGEMVADISVLALGPVPAAASLY